MIIREVTGREVLDSRGFPTVYARVVSEDGAVGEASVPSGASVGKFEAVELRDGDPRRFGGKGVLNAVQNVNTVIASKMVGKNFTAQAQVDDFLCRLDNTKNKSWLGANAILAVSMAAARVGAKSCRMELYEYLRDERGKYILPTPMMNILNGGVHAGNTVDIQEFMVMPVGAGSFREAMRMGSEVYMALKANLKKDGLGTAVGDEGGFAPDLKDSREVLEQILEAVTKAGYEPGEDIGIAIDAAASELYDENKDAYYFPGESKMTGKEVLRDASEMIDYYEKLLDEFPIVSIEDGLQEDDWEGWKDMTSRIGNRVQLVGDDLFVTNIKRLSCGIRLGTANAILIKVNQIGTLTESLEAVELAARAGYRSVISHRSGETEDSFIADLAVATGAGQIKTGAPCRSDRNAKYNQLLRIHEQLGGLSVYENPFA